MTKHHYSPETFKKISWVEGISELFENGILTTKRLDKMLDHVQKELMYAVVRTLEVYFELNVNQNYINEGNKNKFEPVIKNLSEILPRWISGLCDVSVAQIIGGLLDILNLKTKYQEYPPRSIMQFHAVCKTARPPYHDVYFPLSNNLLALDFDKTAIRKRSEEIAVNHLKGIYKILGKKYEERPTRNAPPPKPKQSYHREANFIPKT